MMVRMLRALVTRAAEGDTIALEQLARVEAMAGHATGLGLQLAHDRAGYSWGELGQHTQQTRQGVQQRVGRLQSHAAAGTVRHPGHVLVPGHTVRSCAACKAVA